MADRKYTNFQPKWAREGRHEFEDFPMIGVPDDTPTITDDDLLARARVFDAGPPPTINQYVLDEDDDSQGHNLTVEYRGETGWAICRGVRSCLNKETGLYAFEAMPTHRDPEYIALTRFATAKEAFEFLAEWKPKAREAALRLPHMVRWKDQLELWAKGAGREGREIVTATPFTIDRGTRRYTYPDGTVELVWVELHFNHSHLRMRLNDGPWQRVNSLSMERAVELCEAAKSGAEAFEAIMG